MKYTLYNPAVLLAILVLFPFIAISAHAFSQDHCGNLFPKSDGVHPPYYSPIYVSTMIPSTTSYFSSIGPCSMYGDNVQSRSAFIKSELKPLQLDAARGEGEYLNTLAQLEGCPVEDYPVVGEVLRKEFGNIFGMSPGTAGAGEAPDAAVVMKRIDSVIKTESRLGKSCRDLI